MLCYGLIMLRSFAAFCVLLLAAPFSLAERMGAEYEVPIDKVITRPREKAPLFKAKAVVDESFVDISLE